MSGLEQKFPGKVTARNVDASKPDAREDLKELGFKTHGLVIRAADGKVLFKQADHTVRMERVETALHELLGT